MLRTGLGAGLTFLWSPWSQFMDLAGRRAPSTIAGNGLALRAGPGGLAGTNPSGNTVTYNLQTTPGASSQNYTVLAFILNNGAGGTQNPIDADDGGVGRIFQLRLNANAGEFIPFDSNGSNFATGTNTAPTNRPVLLAGRVQNSVASVWLDGVRTIGNTMSGTPRTLASPSALLMIGDRVGGSGVFGGQIYMAAHFSRALSDVELISLSRNPWQLFDSRIRRINFAGPVVPTLSAATAFAITSNSARPRVTITF